MYRHVPTCYRLINAALKEYWRHAKHMRIAHAFARITRAFGRSMQRLQGCMHAAVPGRQTRLQNAHRQLSHQVVWAEGAPLWPEGHRPLGHGTRSNCWATVRALHWPRGVLQPEWVLSSHESKDHQSHNCQNVDVVGCVPARHAEYGLASQCWRGIAAHLMNSALSAKLLSRAPTHIAQQCCTQQSPIAVAASPAARLHHASTRSVRALLSPASKGHKCARVSLRQAHAAWCEEVKCALQAHNDAGFGER